MLKKEICKECIKKEFHSGWTDAEERDWKKGEVICPFTLKTGALKIEENPPTGCPNKNAYRN